MVIKSLFLKNILTLFSGTACAQLLSFACSPLLSRIFSPEDFALQAVFTSVSSLFLVFTTGKYEQAIIIAEKDNDSLDNFFLTTLLCSVVSVLSFFFIILLSNWNKSFFVLVDEKLVFFTVFFIFFSGINTIFSAYFLRKARFKRLARRSILATLCTVTLNLTGGFFFYSKRILIISTSIAQTLITIYFIVNLIHKDKFDFKTYTFQVKNIFLQAKKNITFPLFMLPGQFLNQLSSFLPLFFFTSAYSLTEIGYYSFLIKVAQIPIGLVTGSVSEVYKQKLVTTQRRYHKTFFFKTTLLLCGIVIIPAIICYIFSPQIFSGLFGEKWRFTGNLARKITFMLVTQFITTPLSGAIFIVYKKLGCNFVLQLVRFGLVFFSLFYSINVLKLDLINSVYIYGLVMTLWYIISFFCSVYILNRSYK